MIKDKIKKNDDKILSQERKTFPTGLPGGTLFSVGLQAIWV